MRALGRLLWMRKARIFGVTLICGAGAFVVVNAMTPQYRSEARILLEARENVFMRAEADKNADRTTIDEQAVASQIQVVLSRDLARKVIAGDGLADKPEFDPDANKSPWQALLASVGLGRDRGAMSREERTMEAYYDHLSVQAIEKSRVIVIEFSSADPALAARVANDIAETYLQMQQVAKQDQTRAAGTWLAGEIEKMRQKVADAEANVEAYRVKANLFAGTNNTSLPSQQLTEINSQIAAARGRKADLEARARQLRALIRSGRPIESSDIANSESMRRLVEQRIAVRAQLAEQSTTLGPRHPRIKELNAQVAEIDRQIRGEGERLARQLDNDAKVAGNRLQELTESLNQVKKLASQTNEQDVALRALEREAKTQRDLLESYLVKYREAAARDSINAAPPEARIISSASRPLKPAYPKKLPTVLIAAFAGFALSAGFTVTGALLAPAPSPYPSAYAYDLAAPDYGAPDHAPAPVIPIMPRMQSPPVVPPATGYYPATAAPTPMQPMPVPAPMAAPVAVSSIEQIAAGLMQAGEAGRSVAVMGSMRDVGTTYAAITLARLLAEHGSVVLVDCAFGAPNLAVISTEPDSPGVADLVRGTASFGDIITRDQYSSVHLVAAGEVGNDAPALAASPMLQTVIEALAQSYDHVVIDAGSAADVAVEYFAPLAGRAVLVSADPADPATQSAHGRMMMSGFAHVAVLAGGPQAAAA
jgi:uncharacterized protein involved in exopolysaccharide biosynthesis/Mrp family chromosome partitioning ATPase